MHRLGRGIFIVALFFTVFVVVDFISFFRICHSYRTSAEKLFEQLAITTHPHEVIVVITGDQHRIPRAMELLRHRKGPLLVISGMNPQITLTDLVNSQGRAAENLHEVWSKILVEAKSSSTIENAMETRKTLKDRTLSYLILVTSDYHMHRALTVFRKAFTKTLIYPFVTQSTPSDLHFLIKTSWEYSKWILYRVYGRFLIRHIA